MKKNDLTEFKAFKLINSWKGLRKSYSMKHMAGDASGRQYFRIFLEDEETCVLMISSDTSSKEFGRGNQFDDFLSMTFALDNAEIAVPRIFAKDSDSGTMLLEDLGDLTLYSLIQTSLENKYGQMKKAVDLLIDFQEKLNKRLNCNSAGDKRSFNAGMLMNEYFHFHEYMVEKRIYHPSWQSLRGKVRPLFKSMLRELQSIPFVLSHRDFQSKNIMAGEDRFYLIDYQDALMAPVVYDLVALLRDSYVVLSDEELFSLMSYYWEKSELAQNIIRDREIFERQFHLQTVQRKMKDAGRFMFINQVKGDSRFLKFVSPSLKYVRKSLAKLDKMELIEIYRPFIPEFSTLKNRGEKT